MSREGKREALSRVLSHWPFEVAGIRPVKDVFLVRTAQGPKCLKLVARGRDKVTFMAAVVDHMIRKGFDHVCRFIRTADGPPFLEAEGGFYVLSDWVEGRQCDFRKPYMLVGGTRTLAGFHRAAAGCALPYGLTVKRRWGKWPRTLTRRHAQLESYKRHASESLFKTTFDKRFLESVDYYLELAAQSLSVLGASGYAGVAAREEAARSICHGDAAGRNFVMRDDGKVFVIDLDCIKFDTRLHDIYKIMRRTLKKVSWKEETGRFIVDTYNSENPLDEDEYPVLYAFLLFPQKFWRIANRYYDGEHEWREARYVGKLEKHVSQRREQARFLKKFAELFPASVPPSLSRRAAGLERDARPWAGA